MKSTETPMTGGMSQPLVRIGYQARDLQIAVRHLGEVRHAMLTSDGWEGPTTTALRIVLAYLIAEPARIAAAVAAERARIGQWASHAEDEAEQASHDGRLRYPYDGGGLEDAGRASAFRRVQDYLAGLADEAPPAPPAPTPQPATPADEAVNYVRVGNHPPQPMGTLRTTAKPGDPLVVVSGADKATPADEAGEDDGDARSAWFAFADRLKEYGRWVAKGYDPMGDDYDDVLRFASRAIHARVKGAARARAASAVPEVVREAVAYCSTVARWYEREGRDDSVREMNREHADALDAWLRATAGAEGVRDA